MTRELSSLSMYIAPSIAHQRPTVIVKGARQIPRSTCFLGNFPFYSLDLSQAFLLPFLHPPSPPPPSPAMAKSADKKVDKKAEKKAAKSAAKVAAVKETTPAKTKPISSKEILAKANVHCLA